MPKGRYLCEVCQIGFPEQQQLNWHMVIHVLQKAKYKCVQSNMAFRYEIHLDCCYYVDNENMLNLFQRQLIHDLSDVKHVMLIFFFKGSWSNILDQRLTFMS